MFALFFVVKCLVVRKVGIGDGVGDVGDGLCWEMWVETVLMCRFILGVMHFRNFSTIFYSFFIVFCNF